VKVSQRSEILLEPGVFKLYEAKLQNFATCEFGFGSLSQSHRETLDKNVV